MTEHQRNKTNDSKQDEEIDLFEIFKILKDRARLISSITISLAILGAIYSLLLTPMYRSNVLMVPAGEDGNNQLAAYASRFSGIASLAGINLTNTSSDKSTALAIIKSRSFSLKFINDKNLMPLMFSQQWDANNEQWEDDKKPTDWDAYLYFSSAISISEDPLTGLISLIVEWDDPEIAALVANNLVRSVNQHIRDQEIEETTRSIEFLEEELSKTNLLNAQTVLFNIIEEQTKNIMLANVREEYAFKIIDPAVKPQDRFSPQRKQIVFISTLLGIVLSIIFILVEYFFYNEDQNLESH